MNDNYLEVLDLMARGDVYQSSWDDLKKICLDYSRSTMKKEKDTALQLLKELVRVFQSSRYLIYSQISSRTL